MEHFFRPSVSPKPASLEEQPLPPLSSQQQPQQAGGDIPAPRASSKPRPRRSSTHAAAQIMAMAHADLRGSQPSSASSGSTAATTCSLSAAVGASADSQQHPEPQLLPKAQPQAQTPPPAQQREDSAPREALQSPVKQQDQEEPPHPGCPTAGTQGIRAREQAPKGLWEDERAGSGAEQAAAAVPERRRPSQASDLASGTPQDPIVLCSASDDDGPSPIRQFPGSNHDDASPIVISSGSEADEPHKAGTRRLQAHQQPNTAGVRQPRSPRIKKDQRHGQWRGLLHRSAEAGRPQAATPASTGFLAVAPTVAVPELGSFPSSQLPTEGTAAAESAPPAGASLRQKRPWKCVVSPSTSPSSSPERASSPPQSPLRKKRYPFPLVDPLRSACKDSDQLGSLQASHQQGHGNHRGAGGAAAAAAAAVAPAPAGTTGAPLAAGPSAARAATAGTVPLEELGLSNTVVQALQHACQLNNVMVQFMRLTSPSGATG